MGKILRRDLTRSTEQHC